MIKAAAGQQFFVAALFHDPAVVHDHWAMSALRSALLGQAAGTLRAAGVLLAIAAVMGTLAAWRINLGWPRSRLLL